MGVGTVVSYNDLTSEFPETGLQIRKSSTRQDSIAPWDILLEVVPHLRVGVSITFLKEEALFLQEGIKPFLFSYPRREEKNKAIQILEDYLSVKGFFR